MKFGVSLVMTDNWPKSTSWSLCSCLDPAVDSTVQFSDFVFLPLTSTVFPR